MHYCLQTGVFEFYFFINELYLTYSLGHRNFPKAYTRYNECRVRGDRI
ncbi:unnamed protein product [Staurois parvus]|uniref:Uncharacterized protein n=1 Tax=Staurois parvus TaxID=386267 RepID=A0ABN9AVG2_9NEOB|nr:unnamed protein product [Staurois parvus]